MAQFNVIIEDVNSKEFVSYDVMPYLAKCWKEAKDKPQTFDDLKTFIKNHSRYQWCGRCEYEIVLKSWVGFSGEKKIDVHYQIMNNIDVISKLLMEEVNANMVETH